MADQDDQQLIRSTLAGQSDAFGHLIQKYKDRLYNGMVQILRSEAEAEDVSSEMIVQRILDAVEVP